ncbi:MAG: septal ring lytic transglycosylase RlpA family protein [Deltaproteobacteria bacterium]|nr:septal ring lytic transglycosylase RlpA family protein [Deltaproteobacteria bacterium]
MRFTHGFVVVLAACSALVAGCSAQQAHHRMQSHAPAAARSYHATGSASWYGRYFHGRRTASGERFNQRAMTCAHRHLPFGTQLRVTNLANDRSIVVRVNDRGPFVRGRIVDLSHEAARQLQFIGQGHTKVRLEAID